MQTIGLHIKFPTYSPNMSKQILNNPKYNIVTIHSLLRLFILYDASQSSNYLVYQIMKNKILHSYKTIKHVCQSGITTLGRSKIMASVGSQCYKTVYQWLSIGCFSSGLPMVTYLGIVENDDAQQLKLNITFFEQSQVCYTVSWCTCLGLIMGKMFTLSQVEIKVPERMRYYSGSGENDE